MLLYQRFVPGLAIASYLVADERTGEAAVIDPTRDVDGFLQYARDNDLHIRHILETHVHADFVVGSRELKARLRDGATIHASGLGGRSGRRRMPITWPATTTKWRSVRCG
jgi:hydroxyacylglutathione hydrolase